MAESLRYTYEVQIDHYACDLTDITARAGLFTYILEQMFTFQMVINVAGVDYEGLFNERRQDEIRTIVGLNIESTLEVTHELLDAAAVGQTLRIINVSSLAAFYPMPVKATYAASKRFLLDFSLALRNELKDRCATVTVLCPAGMPTTPTSMDGIEAQGMMGLLTTQDIGLVAAKTIDQALKGRAVVIPGFVNQLLQMVGGLIPSAGLTSLIGNRWRAAQKKRA